MALIVEHSNISNALVATKTVAKSIITDTVLFTSTVPVLIAWSKQGTLLLRPEYAWLSRPEVVFVRLPQPLDSLRKHAELARKTLDPVPGLDILATPIGQWRWAVERLRHRVEKNNKKEAIVRVVELRRFASKCWPGWYEKVLAGVQDAVETGSGAIETLDILNGQVSTVAALEACRPLLAWSTSGPYGNRIALLEDALCYAMQGLGEMKVITELAADDPWWSDLENDLANSEGALSLVQIGGGDPEVVLVDRIVEVKRSLEELCKLSQLGAELSPGTIYNAHLAIDTLQRAVNSILTFRSRYHAQFLSRLSRV